MPAAKPSKARITNVVAGLTAAGLRPSSVRVHPDGSIVVEVAGGDLLEEPANLADSIARDPGRPRKFGEPKY